MPTIKVAINQYARALKNASVWNNPKDIVRDVNGSRPDFVYEFYCYIRIMLDLKSNYELKYEEGTGAKKNKFPKAPAKKRGRPFFKLIKGTKVKYQVCAGTKIKVKKGKKTKAPDISFQVHDSPDKPVAKHVKLIMDAKYNEQKDKSLQGNQFSDFTQMIRDLDVLDAKNKNILFDKLTDIEGNCLISFGETYTTDHKYLKFNRLCEIKNFNTKDNFKVIK